MANFKYSRVPMGYEGKHLRLNQLSNFQLRCIMKRDLTKNQWAWWSTAGKSPTDYKKEAKQILEARGAM